MKNLTNFINESNKTTIEYTDESVKEIIESIINNYEGIYSEKPIYAQRIVDASLTETSSPRYITVTPCRNGDDYLNSGGYIIIAYTKITD